MFSSSDNNGEGNDMEPEDEMAEGTAADAQAGGWFDFVMQYSKITYTPLEKAFDTPIMLVFMALEWQIKENRKEM